MISIVAFLFVLGLLIVVHEFGHFWAAKKVGVRVEKFCLGFGKKLFSTTRGGTEYGLNLIPLGGYVKLAGDNREEYKGGKDEYMSHPIKDRAAIIFMGPVLNYVLGFVFFWIIFMAGYPVLTTKVGGLVDGFGAKDAGITVGDRIISVDGVNVSSFEEMQKIIYGKKAAQAIRLSVERNGKTLAVDVPVKEKNVDDMLGSKRTIGVIGVFPAEEVIYMRHGPVASCILAGKKTLDLTCLTYKALWRMINRKLSMRDSVTGPLGIFYITSAAAHIGFIALMNLIAALSVSLALFNLLPLPVLDGGHILFLAIEKIRGKPLSAKAEDIIMRIGITLLLAIAVLVTYNDIMRFFGAKIAKFIK